MEFLIWDYAGQHMYRATHQCLFTQQALYLLVFDLTEEVSKSTTLLFGWVKSIQSCIRGAVFLVIGTKRDVVDIDEARESTTMF